MPGLGRFLSPNRKVDASKSGPNQGKIAQVALWIASNIDPDCDRWLGGAVAAINALLGDGEDDRTIWLHV
jgi:hypothetical protein